MRATNAPDVVSWCPSVSVSATTAVESSNLLPMAKQTRKELEKQMDDMRLALSCADIVLADLVKGDVHWFGHGAFRLGVVRPKSATGGYCLVVRDGIATAHMFERFAPDMLRHIDSVITGRDDDYNRALLNQRTTIEKAREFIHNSNR